MSSSNENPRSGGSHKAKSNLQNTTNMRRDPFRSHSLYGTTSTNNPSCTPQCTTRQVTLDHRQPPYAETQMAPTPSLSSDLWRGTQPFKSVSPPRVNLPSCTNVVDDQL